MTVSSKKSDNELSSFATHPMNCHPSLRHKAHNAICHLLCEAGDLFSLYDANLSRQVEE
jgi:hypothetical protein